MISHPHFYTTHVEWAQTFDCPVYIASNDQGWLCRRQPSFAPISRKVIGGPLGILREILPGVNAIKLGGHFPGSLVLLWEKKLFVADTLLIVPVSDFPLSPLLYISL